jgi:tetratricopeptide (TPR) repeat protein
LSEDEAAKVIQSLWRKRSARDFAIGDFLQIVRALRFQRDAESKYQKNPESLSSIINYALICHTQKFDFVQAKKLYKKAFKMAPNNPVLLNAYALFTLADCKFI